MELATYTINNQFVTSIYPRLLLKNNFLTQDPVVQNVASRWCFELPVKVPKPGNNFSVVQIIQNVGR